jgi:MEMO1 family protein
MLHPSALAGTWYPGSPGELVREIEDCLAGAAGPGPGEVRALIAPHAGLMYSGPVGAWAYKAAAGQTYDVAVLVGPSHYVAFDGVAIYPEGAFATPLGHVPVDAAGARALASAPVIRALPRAHQREHALEMQLPFLQVLFPALPIVPLLIGRQDRATVDALATALGGAFAGRRALLVASTDLSHHFDARTARALDSRVHACLAAFDPDALMGLLEQYPEEERGRYVACGGGAAVAVMRAARTLGAAEGRVLRHADSGEVSGDTQRVVGYVAAAFSCAGPTEPSC